MELENYSELRNAEDDLKAIFAEVFDLQVTVCHDNQGEGYHLNLTSNIPSKRNVTLVPMT